MCAGQSGVFGLLKPGSSYSFWLMEGRDANDAAGTVRKRRTSGVRGFFLTASTLAASVVALAAIFLAVAVDRRSGSLSATTRGLFLPLTQFLATAILAIVTVFVTRQA